MINGFKIVNWKFTSFEGWGPYFFPLRGSLKGGFTNCQEGSQRWDLRLAKLRFNPPYSKSLG